MKTLVLLFAVAAPVFAQQAAQSAQAAPPSALRPHWVDFRRFQTQTGGDQSEALTAAMSATSAEAGSTGTGGAIFLPCGTYTFATTIEWHHDIAVIGANRWCVTVNATGGPSNPWLRYVRGRSPDPLHSPVGMRISGFTFHGSSMVQLNTPGMTDAEINASNFIMNVVIDDVWAVGTYNPSKDPNANSTVIPPLSELRSYGVAIDATVCFDIHITDSWFQSFGIGAQLDSCDNANVTTVRFQKNARSLHLIGRRRIGMGNEYKFFGVQMLHDYRIGGTYLDHTNQVNFILSHWEGTEMTEVMSAGDTGTVFEHCGILGGPTTSPFFNLAPAAAGVMRDNDFAGPVGSYFTMSGSNFNNFGNPAARYMMYFDNNFQMPLPNAGQIQLGQYNPLLFSPTNSQYVGSTLYTNGYSWFLDPVTKRLALDIGSRNQETWPVQFSNTSYRNYLLRITNRRASAAPREDVFMHVVYVEGSSSSLFNNFIGTPANTNTNIVDLPLTLPDGATGTGVLTLTMAGNGTNYVERIELIPQTSAISYRTYTICAAGVTGCNFNLSGSGTVEDVTLNNYMPPNGKICGTNITHAQAFTGGGVASATLSLGGTGAPAAFGAPFNISQPPADNRFQETALFHAISKGGQPLTAQVVTTGGRTGGMTSGKAQVDICIVNPTNQ